MTALAVQLFEYAFVTVGFAFVILLRAQHGWGALFFLVGCCWQADNGALFVGSAFGRFTPKFLPTVSPNKTYAGVVGALLFSTCSAFGYAWLASVGDDEGKSSAVKFAAALVPELPFTDPNVAAGVGLVMGITAIVVRRAGATCSFSHCHCQSISSRHWLSVAG